jgi:(p)ppGpp synthase/HD superfamily hydrolase
MQACYSRRLDAALALAAEVFRDKVRKGTGTPYLCHLLQVATWVGEWGGDEDQIIAGLLHDYLEDIDGARPELLRQQFGERVSHLVLALSDTTVRPKPPWQERKTHYLATLRDEPAEVKLVSACDKLHNARCIVRDFGLVGEALWGRFTATREQTAWYYRGALTALGSGWQHPLLGELEVAVAEVERAARSSG